MIAEVRQLRRLGRDRRGVSAVEFAVLAPVMLYMLCGIVELGHMIFARQALEGAMVEAARAASATMERSEADRKLAMETAITRQMSAFPMPANKSISIVTKVYADFASASPEVYTDVNKNNSYDAGEPFVDRNKNGQWDPATPKAGTMGNPGDVIAYTIRYPKHTLFTFVTNTFGITDDTIMLGATTVVRNEATVRKGA